MKVLVTGASGYIGSVLVPYLLNAGHEVFAVYRQFSRTLPAGATGVAVDFSQAGWTDRLPVGIDTVIHLAQSRRHRESPPAIGDLVRVNVLATGELADWSRIAGVRRFVLASTGTVYGCSDGASTESDATDPRTAYAATKLSAELILRQYASYFDVLMLRIFGVYGPGTCSSIFARLPQMLEEKQPVTLAGGTGLQLNPIYIDDCVAAISTLAVTTDIGNCEVINVGGPVSVSLEDAVSIVEKAMKLKAEIRATNDRPMRLVGNVERMMQIVGERRFVSLERGLQNVVAAREKNSVV